MMSLSSACRRLHYTCQLDILRGKINLPVFRIILGTDNGILHIAQHGTHTPHLINYIKIGTMELLHQICENSSPC